MSQVLEAQAVTVTPIDVASLPSSLTVRQKLFIFHYIETRNASKAARLAGYSGNANTVSSAGWENLQKPVIKAEIARLLAEKVATAQQVLVETTEIAMTPISQLATGKKAAPIDVDAKLKALELMGRHHRLFTDRVEIDQPTDSKQLASEIVAALLELRQQASAASASMDQPGHVDQPRQPQLGVAQDIAVELPADNKE